MTNIIDVASALGQNIYKLKFTKADGSLRDMRATRMSAFIPTDKAPKTEKTITETQTNLPVFDLDIQEWRSVRPEAIISMEVV